MDTMRSRHLGQDPAPSAAPAPAGERQHGQGQGQVTQEQLLRLIKRLNRSLGLPPGRATDGVATASAQMLSKMVSRYEVTRVSIQQTQRTIEQHTEGKYEAFLDAYTNLKDDLGGNGGHLDRYLTVVARILADKDLSDMLTNKTSEGGSQWKQETSQPPQLQQLQQQRRVGGGPLTLVEKKAPDVASVRTAADRYKADLLNKAASGGGRDFDKENTPSSVADGPGGGGGFAVRSPYRGNMVEHKLHMDEISGSLTSSRKRGGEEAEAPSQDIVPVEQKAYDDTQLLQTAANMFVNKNLGTNRKGHFLQLSNLGGSEEPESEEQQSSDCPKLPHWTLSHPVIYSGQGIQSLLLDNPPTSYEIHSEYSLLEPKMQELMLIDDLLYVFLGSKGKLIYPRYRKESERIDFVVDQTLDHSLRILAEKFLPICVSLQVFQVFIESRFEYRYGLINHALAAVVKELVWEWRLLVSQMESILQDGKLSLHSMWYYCQPSVGMLQAVSDILTKVINQKLHGAEVLNVVYDSLQNNKGDQSKYNVLLSLMKAVCKPYFEMLKGWLYEGKVEDPYNEFLIIKENDIQKESLTENIMSSYWQQCYRLRECVPNFLEGYTDKILRTGKYLNVVKECQNSDSFGIMQPTDIIYDPNNRNLLATVEKAFSVASQSLLSFLHEKVDMIGRLRSIKRYFLLDQGDFLMHFMDCAGDELEKDASEVSVRRLQSLFELAVKMSSSATDLYNEDAFCNISSINLVDLLSGFIKKGKNSRTLQRLEANDKNDGAHMFRLDYKVSWPFSLVVTRKTLIKYQLIFGHLFQFKFLERKLAQSWQEQQLLRQQRLDGTEDSLRESLLCKEMLHFVNNYLSFMTFETIEPKWQVLEAKLRSASTIDEVIEEHENFLDSVMDSCYLLDLSPYALIKDIKNVCLSYGNFILRAYNRDSSEVAEIGDKFHALLKELIGLNLEMNFLASYPRTNYL